MKICPKCREKYTSPDDEFCANDGARLVLELDLEVDPMVGRTVAGRYDVVGIIGSGGMGTVYRAVQKPIDRVVALKVLKQELTDDRVAVGRFRREAKAASLLSSLHTVTLYEAGEDEDETLFLAMELLEGRSLSGLLFNSRSLPWRDAVEIARQTTESLTEAHEKGIVHRDLKPENIFLVSEGASDGKLCVEDLCVKVLDFGIATLTRPERGVDVGLTRTGVIVGTPGYMSPEQAKGQKADARSDIYALGCLLYEMLTGKPPFESSEAVLLMGQHISARVPPFETRIPRGEVPEAVEAVVMQMLEKDPQHRPQTARELLSTMTKLLDETYVVPEEVLARQREEEDEQKEKPPWRSPKVAVALAVALVLAVGVGVGLTFDFMGTSGGRVDGGLPARSTPTARVTPGDGGASDEAQQRVSVHVAVEPREARILLDGVAIGQNPWTGERPRSSEEHRLVVEADGYVRQEHTLRFDSDLRLLLALVREAPDTPSRPEGKRPPRGGRPTRGAHGPRQLAGKVGTPPPRHGPPATSAKRPQKRPEGVNLEIDSSFPTGM